MKEVKVLALVIVSIIFCSVVAFAQGSDEKDQAMMEEKMKQLVRTVNSTKKSPKIAIIGCGAIAE